MSNSKLPAHSEAIRSIGPFPSVVPAKAGTQGALEGRVTCRHQHNTGFPLSREWRDRFL